MSDTPADPAAPAGAAGGVCDLTGARHAEVVDRHGARLGTLEQVYRVADDAQSTPVARWLEVASPPFGMAVHLVPAPGARLEDSDGPGVRVRVDTTAERALASPTIDPRDGLTAGEDADLAAHYGIDPLRP